MVPPTLETLPADVHLEILYNTHRDDLLRLVHASPVVYRTMIKAQGLVARNLLRGVMNPMLFPMVITLFYAQKEDWVPDMSLGEEAAGEAYTAKVIAFCTKYLAGHQVGPLPNAMHFTLEMGIKMVRFHEHAEPIAQEVAGYVGKHIVACRSEMEYFRIQKCVYIYELARLVASWKVVKDERETHKFIWSRPIYYTSDYCAPKCVCHLPRSVKHYSSVNKLNKNETLSYPDHRGKEDRLIAQGSDSLVMKNSISGWVQKTKYLWLPLERGFSVREVFELAMGYGNGHDGPRDLYLWAYLYDKLRPFSPLHALKVGWGETFDVGLDEHHELIDGKLVYFKPWFGNLNMKRLSFNDRPKYPRSGRTFPLMSDLIREAEAIINSESKVSKANDAKK
ncbi:uncharacterized protein F4822DRAFT_441423 [Hypoxylon trugodes]|uniref:uncharacterized protein n=1 Tax=Hypoxylon trugodes TaxID=326681 RepID=UPI00219C07A4|nr:uncharacterized protein F4822DRAFT_441423 [Hypoxylon trugodes]KAI1392470.1 hypothetical protein F4822DRAFT_441423 [Hypoxylon trugodes]